jgi:hypothetical protein
MAIACHLPSGTVVNIEDLPIEVLEDVTVSAGLSVREWYNVAYSPAVYPRAAIALMAACAKHVDEEAPPAGFLTPGNILDVFTRAEEDLPGSYVDGLPDPKVEDVLATI